MLEAGDDVAFLETSGIGKTWKHIDKVRDSYSTGFGIIAEPIQNSVDVIRQADERFDMSEFTIRILIDSDSESFVIRDNGLGMDIESAPKYASPNETDKTFADTTIGEMGVEFTYLTFSTNELIVESQSKRDSEEGNSGYIKYKVEGAYDWYKEYDGVENPDLEEMEDNMPTASILEKEPADAGEIDESDTYTKITAKDVEAIEIANLADDTDDDDAPDNKTFFECHPKRLMHYLRAETALGNTRALLCREVEDITPLLWFGDIDDAFDSVDSDDSHEVMYEYITPDQYWNDRGVIDLTENNELEDKLTDVHDHENVTLRSQVTVMDDSSKEEIFSKRPWVKYGSVGDRGTDDLFYYAVFLPRREMFDEIGEEKVEELVWWDISSGIYVATKGMPTSEEVPTPTRTAEAGYWSNVFIIFNYDSIDYDYGRKVAKSRTRGMFREIATDVFDDFREFTQYTGKEGDSPVDPTEEMVELADVSDLETNDIPWKKEPNDQEASVMMIFAELVSEGTLGNYEGWRAGLKTTYDWLGKYTGDTEFKEEIITIEFKPYAEAIHQDKEEGVKKVTEIDIVVAWNINTDTMEDNYNWNVESDIDQSRPNVYEGVTHRIQKGGVDCWVISLSETIDGM